MSIKEHELWKIFVNTAAKEDSSVASTYEEAVWKVCQYGIDLSKTIRDTFKTYTLHDEAHICNVMTIMLKLLGDLKTNLTRDECALLIMAACCHDIGMSITDEEKIYLRNCPDCMQTYLEEHPNDYNVAYEHGLQEDATITDEILQHYIRANHHKRVYEQLQNVTWPEILGHSMSVGDLISVCQNHGEDTADIRRLQHVDPNLDLYLCSVLLRLGDILDFDATRASDTLYRYINLAHLDGMENEKSRLEWQKHQASRGFKFVDEGQRELIYRAECTSIQIEQAIVSYLNWIDSELTECGKIIRYMEQRWHALLLPGRVQREITSKGYLSGEYKLTLDQDRVLDLLVGRELYSDPAVFVRELIQNAIDAIRTRKQLDKNLPIKWTPQINIRTWVDNEGFYWFRIEDNGIGMTEQTIKEYFLKVGHSYYNSDKFKADKIRFGANINYEPISQFGIGILSCFMGDPKNNWVEVTTKHFEEKGVRYPAYRLSIHGINGYYYIANDHDHRTMALKMPDNSKSDQSFISHPGTIIAVRTNLYQSGSAQSFKDIIDKYVVYPEVPIHYEGIGGECDYKTEQEFIDYIQALTPKPNDGIYQPIERISMPEEYYSQLLEMYPELVWDEKLSIGIYCLPLNYFTQNPLIKGVTFLFRAEGTSHWNAPGLEKKYIPEVEFILHKVNDNDILVNLFFSCSSVFREELEKHVLPAIKSQLQKLGINLDPEKDIFFRHNKLPLISFHDSDGVSLAEIRAYQAINSPFTYYVSYDIFKQFPWFQDLFGHYIKSTNFNHWSNISVNAHNGIFLNNDLLLATDRYILANTILILKDEYRPSLNLSRNKINNLPLEANCTLEALADCIQHSLKTLRPAYQNYILTPLKDYWRILELSSFSSSKLHYSTNLGTFSLSEIGGALEKHEKLILTEKISNSFHVAALLQQFDLKFSFDKKDKLIIYIVKDEDNSFKEKLLLFPPALFISPFSGDNVSMGLIYRSGTFVSNSYNASHRFSQWLIKNAVVLQNFVPGIYSQIISQLQNEDDIIKNINTSLSFLRKIPNLGIEIPEDLTLDDFFMLDD